MTLSYSIVGKLSIFLMESCKVYSPQGGVITANGQAKPCAELQQAEAAIIASLFI